MFNKSNENEIKIQRNEGCECSIFKTIKMEGESSVALNCTVGDFFGENKNLYMIGSSIGDIYYVIPHKNYETKKIIESKKTKLAIAACKRKENELVLAYCVLTSTKVLIRVYKLIVKLYIWDEKSNKFEKTKRYEKEFGVPIIILHFLKLSKDDINLVISFQNLLVMIYPIDEKNIKEYFDLKLLHDPKKEGDKINLLSKIVLPAFIISIDSFLIKDEYVQSLNNKLGFYLIMISNKNTIYAYYIENIENIENNKYEWRFYSKIMPSVYKIECSLYSEIIFSGIYESTIMEKSKFWNFINNNKIFYLTIPFIEAHDQIICTFVQNEFLFVGTYNGNVLIFEKCNNNNYHLISRFFVYRNITAIFCGFLLNNNMSNKHFYICAVINKNITFFDVLTINL